MQNTVINNFSTDSENSWESSFVPTCLADTASCVSSILCLLQGTSSTITVDALELKLESDVSEKALSEQSEISKTEKT